MKTPFNAQQFFGVFEKYNTVVFPAQLVILLAGIGMIVLLFTEKNYRHVFVGAMLAVFWIWNSVIYFFSFFTSLNKSGWLFGIMFLFEGIYLSYSTFKTRLRFSFVKSMKNYLACFFIVFGIFIYPVIGIVKGEDLTRVISLGLPCPTTIFTIGFLMLSYGKSIRNLLIIPTIWSLMGISAGINFNLPQDFLMILAAVTVQVYFRNKNNAVNNSSRWQMHG